jgi:c-di-GMP-binding flagellar brake protein YcgR
MRKKERRNFIRLEVHHLAKYRPLSDTKEEPPYILATVRDIGAGGLCLLTEESLPLSTLVQLKINFPGISTAVFTLAKVVWIRQIKKAKRYLIGTQFVEIDESIRKGIDGRAKFVQAKLNEQKGGLTKLLQFLERRTKK